MIPIPLDQMTPRASENLSGVARDQYVLSEEDMLCFTCPLPQPRCLGRFCPITLYRKAKAAFEAKETAAFVRLAGKLRKTRERFRV